jgi:hypothetical protein
MKKFLLFAICAIAFSSCYNTKVLVGNVDDKTPMVEVNTVCNHHLICGLVPLNNAAVKAADYVGGRADYMVKTNQTFLNFLVNWLTCGIYTPTQTTFYVPLNSLSEQK